MDRSPRTEIEPGTIFAGKYKLLEAIGEGGMGAVWMAQQIEPVRRHVAIKLIKTGLDSKNVVARFEAERQALSMMDHPNIARVFDVGTTSTGRPFFVMELVKGTPITDFCDQRKLTSRQRLELFIPVCQAIQHAHQKGVIHRDIKPSNVLVSLHDDKPIPKVIDFGVAKATGTPLTEKTLHTGFEQVVGTPAYMSPEQATFNQLDIDTRSDVYSLGVLLYELLTGTTPIERARFKQAALLEMLRVVREEEPPRPSTRLSSTETKAGIAEKRGTEPTRLSRELRSELDWVVMKSLEKDRARRYETASGFAADVQRYLAGDPVQAHPPSMSYRVKKFMRRNRAGVISAAAVLVAVLAGGVGLAFGLVENAERRAERARVQEEQQVAEYKAQLEDERRNREERERKTRNEDALRTLLERAEESLRASRLAESVLLLDQATRRAAEAPDSTLNARLLGLQADLALARELDAIDLVVWTPAEGRFVTRDQLLARWEKTFAQWGLNPETQVPSQVAEKLAHSCVRERVLEALDIWYLYKPTPSLRDLLKVIDPDEYRDAVRASAFGKQSRQQIEELAARPEALLQPSRFIIRLGRTGTISDLRRKQILTGALQKRPGDFGLMLLRGGLNYFHEEGELPEREMWFRAALAIRPESAHAHTMLAETLNRRGQDYDSALAHSREAVRLEPRYVWAQMQLARALRFHQEYAESIRLLEAIIRDQPNAGHLLTELAGAYAMANQHEKAVETLRRAIKLDPKSYVARSNLGYHLLLEHGLLDEAIALFNDSLRIEPRFITPKFHIMTAERYRENLPKIKGYMIGTWKDANPHETGAMAEICERPFVKQYVMAVRLYGILIDPKKAPVALAIHEDTPYRAAQAAVQAADGQDREMTHFGIEEWRHLHDRARSWLRADLAALTPLAKIHERRQSVRIYVSAWKRDPSFSSVRDPDRLRQMAEHDRMAWEQFWYEVDSLIQLAADRPALAPAPRHRDDR